MARRRRSDGRSAHSDRRSASASPAPQPVNHAPPPVPAQNGRDGSFVGGVVDGMAFGTGSAVANRVVDSVIGPRTFNHETVVTGSTAAANVPTSNSLGSDACDVHSEAFLDCLNSYSDDISRCQFYMDMLAECRKNSGSTLNA